MALARLPHGSSVAGQPGLRSARRSARTFVHSASQSKRASSAAVGAPRGRALALRCRAIGFDFGDRDEAEDVKGAKAARPKFSSFGLLSSSLLVYQHVLRGAHRYLAVKASFFYLQPVRAFSSSRRPFRNQLGRWSASTTLPDLVCGGFLYARQ